MYKPKRLNKGDLVEIIYNENSALYFGDWARNNIGVTVMVQNAIDYGNILIYMGPNNTFSTWAIDRKCLKKINA